jgi:hypothetical protein
MIIERLSLEWCQKVSRSIPTHTPVELQKMVLGWYYNGKSVDDIKKLLVRTAAAHGKKLVFVGTRGGN